jgi:hypothetical protein
MNLEIQSRLSFYRRLEEVEHKKGISLVRHVETGQIYVEKVLTQYDKSIYDCNLPLYMFGETGKELKLTFHRFMNVWKRMVRYI